jgi:hypothetical protein
MNRSRFSLYFVLALSGLVSTGPSAKSRQTNIFCYYPTDNFVGRGQTFNGKLCRAEWGCSCAVWFCPVCSTLPSPPLSCSLTHCTALPGPHNRPKR